MDEVRIDGGDVTSLAATLDDLQLSADQRKLLSALLNVGRENLGGANAPAIAKNKLDAPFRNQFESAFNPGVRTEDGDVLIKIRG
jgi:hypothetical protein